jgi:hypothetical protein
MFFYCRFTLAVWSIIHAALGLSQPRSMSHMFGTWQRGFRMELKSLFLLGAITTWWSLWLCRNGIVSDNKLISSPLQVIFLIIHWLCAWVILRKTASQDLVVVASQRLTQQLHRIWLLWHLNDWRKWSRTFLPRRMGGGLVYGLMIISAYGSSFFLLLVVCILLCRGQEYFQDVVSSRCNDLGNL